jgi:hypothetical protein
MLQIHSFSATSQLENAEMPPSNLFDEEKCLAMILNPEFVEHLTVLKQSSATTLGAST